MLLMSPARMRAFLPACPPQPRSVAFASVAVVAVALLVLGVPGTALPAAMLALAVLTIVVNGGQTPVPLPAAHPAAAIPASWPVVS